MSFFQYRAANSQQCFMVVAAEGFTSQTGTYTRTWERLCWQKRLLLTTLHGVNRVFWSLQAFSGEKWVCVEEASFVFWWKWLFGFVFFFLVFYFEKLFLRRERFVPCFIFSYGHDSGDHCGKAHFRHVI